VSSLLFSEEFIQVTAASATALLEKAFSQAKLASGTRYILSEIAPRNKKFMACSLKCISRAINGAQPFRGFQANDGL
jgi:hypothetical protein